MALKNILKYTKVLFYAQHIKIDNEKKLVHFRKTFPKTKIVLCIWKSLLLYKLIYFDPHLSFYIHK